MNRIYRAIALLGLSTACLGQSASYAQPVPQSSATQLSILALNQYPDSLVRDFMQGCTSAMQTRSQGRVSAAQSQAYCTCALRQLQQRYTVEQLINRLQNADKNGIQNEILQIAANCATSLSNPPQPASPPRSQAPDLNAQLQQAVNARDWNKAIQVVDRMVVLYPERANELKAYRARLESLRQGR